MPCETVTVQGPDLTGSIGLTRTITGGQEQVTVEYTATNNRNVVTSFDVIVHQDNPSSPIETDSYQDVPINNDVGGSFTIQISDIPEGDQAEVTMCVDVVNVSP